MKIEPLEWHYCEAGEFYFNQNYRIASKGVRQPVALFALRGSQVEFRSDGQSSAEHYGVVMIATGTLEYCMRACALHASMRP